MDLTPEAMDAVKRERKDAVADAALAVALREGINGAGLRAIAREAGCTTGLITHYFPDRRSVIIYALGRNIDRFFKGLEVELAASLTGRAELVAIMRYLAHAGDPVSSGVMFRSLASASTDPEIALLLQCAYDKVHRRARQSVAKGRRDGSLHGSRPAKDVADLAVALADGLYVAGVARPKSYSCHRRDALIGAMVAAVEG